MSLKSFEFIWYKQIGQTIPISVEQCSGKRLR